MQLHTLVKKTPNKKKKLIGRGGSSGKTSGRGGKGQTARAGNKKRPQMRDIIKKLPKLRGRGKNSNKSVKEDFKVVNVGTLDKVFEAGTFITRALLLKNGLIKRTQGVLPQVKILATGELTKKLSISSDCFVSDSAKAKIEQAGGIIK
ncbi:MAG: 50S ribosomal protein L15 [bacterium]